MRQPLGVDYQGRSYWALGSRAGAWRIFVEEPGEEASSTQWGFYEGELLLILMHDTMRPWYMVYSSLKSHRPIGEDHHSLPLLGPEQLNQAYDAPRLWILLRRMPRVHRAPTSMA